MHDTYDRKQVASSLFEQVEALIIRPANTTAYTAGDVIGTAKLLYSTKSFYASSADNVIVPRAGMAGYVTRAQMNSSNGTSSAGSAARFRVWLMAISGADPLSFYTDLFVENVAMIDPPIIAPGFIGYVDLLVGIQFADGFFFQNNAVAMNFQCFQETPELPGTGSRAMVMVLQTLDAFTPVSSQDFRIILGIDIR